MFERIRSVFSVRKIEKDIDGSLVSFEHKVERVTEQSRVSRQKIEQALSTMDKRAVADEKAHSILRGELRSYQVHIDRLEETLQSTRDELRTAREITIPGLIASHQVLISRWEAESKVQMMRSAMATETPGDRAL